MTSEDGELPAATAAAAAGAGPALPPSRVLHAIPSTVYQTDTQKGIQDSSTLMEVVISLSDAAFQSLSLVQDLHTAVTGAIRRFDGSQVQLYCHDSGMMKILKLSPSMFQYYLQPSKRALQVLVHRKYLPASKAHSNAPFKFVWFLHPVREVVCSSAFLVASKQPQQASPKPAPKRQRPPSSKKPCTALPDATDALIDHHLSRCDKKRPLDLPSPHLVGVPSSSSLATTASDVPLAAVAPDSPKRARRTCHDGNLQDVFPVEFFLGDPLDLLFHPQGEHGGRRAPRPPAPPIVKSVSPSCFLNTLPPLLSAEPEHTSKGT